MITISPAALSTTALVANQVSLEATITEKLCRPYCVGSTIQPQVTINYFNGTATLNGSTVFVPITAIITIVLPSSCCNATTRIYTENFTVAFQGQTALPTAVTITNVGRKEGGSNITCCKAHSYTIYDSLTVAITAA